MKKPVYNSEELVNLSIKNALINFYIESNVEHRKQWGDPEPKWGYVITTVSTYGDEYLKEVKKVAAHLVETKQIVLQNDGSAKLGIVLFEHRQKVSAQAEAAAEAIYKDLSDRRGIKQTLNGMDQDVIEEFKNSLAVIIDKHYKR